MLGFVLTLLLGAAYVGFRSAVASTYAAPGCMLAPGVGPDSVKVGLIYPDSGGAEASFGSARAGIDARFAVENADGGVNGRVLAYSWQDDLSSEEANLAAAIRLTAADGVFGVLETSSASGGAAEYLNSRGIPVVGIGTDPAWAEYPNMFTWTTWVSRAAPSVWGEFVAERGGRRAAIVGPEFSPGSARLAESIARSLQAAGIEVVAFVPMSAHGFDAATVARQVHAAGADTLAGPLLAAQLSALSQVEPDLSETIKVTLVTPTGYDPDLALDDGTTLPGTYVLSDLLPFQLDSWAHRTYLDAMAALAPHIHHAQDEAAVAGWITADLFIRGLRAAGTCPTRERFVARLRRVPNYTAGGLLASRVDFESDFGVTGRCFVFLRAVPGALLAEEPIRRCGSWLPAES